MHGFCLVPLTAHARRDPGTNDDNDAVDEPNLEQSGDLSQEIPVVARLVAGLRDPAQAARRACLQILHAHLPADPLRLETVGVLVLTEVKLVQSPP